MNDNVIVAGQDYLDSGIWCENCGKYVRPNIYAGYHGDKCTVKAKADIRAEKSRLHRLKRLKDYELYIVDIDLVIDYFEAAGIEEVEVQFSKYLYDAYKFKKKGSLYDKIRNNNGNLDTRLRT